MKREEAERSLEGTTGIDHLPQCFVPFCIGLMENAHLTLSRAQSCTLRSMLSILPKGHTASSLSRSRSTWDLISVSPQHHWAHVTSAFVSGCPILNRLAFVSVSFSSFKRHNLSISCVKPYLVIVQEKFHWRVRKARVP